MAALNLLAGLALAAGLALVGWPLVGWLLAPRDIVSRIAWSYLSGVALWGILLFTGSLLGVLPLERGALLFLMVVLVMSAITGSWIGLRKPRLKAGCGGPHSIPYGWRFGGIALVAFVSLGVAATAIVNPVVDVDGRATWTAHARYMRAAASVHPEPLLARRFAIAHPQYPPLLPLLQVTALETVAGDDERRIKPLYFSFWPVLILLVWDGGRRLGGDQSGMLAAMLTIGLPFPAFQIDGGAAGVYSDLPLACLIGGAAILLVVEGERLRSSWIAALLLAAAVLTKNEGTLLASAVLVGGAVATLRSPLRFARAWRRLLPPLGATLVAAGLLAWWRTGIPNRLDEDYGALLSPATLAAGFHRLPAALRLIVVESTESSEWLLVWPLILALVVWGVAAGLWRDGPFNALLVVVIAAMGGYLGAYVVSPWSIELLVSVTWSRFLLQQLVPLMLIASIAIARLGDWRE